MRVNPVNEKIQLGDQLHIFTTSRASAEKCLEALESDTVLDCVINTQSGSCRRA